jgi:type I restriction enzyme S subunit
MIDELRPYPEMKPTGLPWLGDVPRHWEVRRIKTLLKEVDNRSESGEEPLLSLRMRQGLVDHLNAGGKPIPPEALVGFRLIEPGQIVMNRMRAAYGLFGVANSRGLVSPDYAVFEPTSAGYNRYLVEVFRLPSLARVFRAESKGLGNGESGFLRLYTDRFGPIPIPYPPLDEQRLIVRFLDWHGAQTAKLIRAKKKLIALLNEQKQAIIHRAVTRGLDPNVKLKPSGIAWLGTVPEGWEVKRLRNVTELRVSNVDKNSFEDEISVRLCNYVDVYKNDIIHADIPFMEATASTAEIERFRLRIGDLIITKDSEDWKDIGVPALVETEADDLV